MASGSHNPITMLLLMATMSTAAAAIFNRVSATVALVTSAGKESTSVARMSVDKVLTPALPRQVRASQVMISIQGSGENYFSSELSLIHETLGRCTSCSSSPKSRVLVQLEVSRAVSAHLGLLEPLRWVIPSDHGEANRHTADLVHKDIYPRSPL